MKTSTTIITAVATGALCCGALAVASKQAETPARSQVPARYKWQTKHLYQTDKVWERDRRKLLGQLKSVKLCQGKLGNGVDTVKRCLDRVFAARRRLAKLNVYARRIHDQDTRVSKYRASKSLMDKMDTKFNSASAYLEPELLALPAAELSKLTAEPKLKDYDQYLRQLLRRKPHVLSPKEEALLAKTTEMQRAGYNMYSTFTAAEMPFPMVAVGGGKKVRMTQALYTRYRSDDDRKVRKRVFDRFFGTYNKYRRTLAGMLATQINANITVAKARKYKSALHAALDANAVPVKVYRQMIKAIHGYLPLLHRYLKLRKRLLGVKQLRYYDMYPPMIKKVALKYPYDAGRKQISRALAPLGDKNVAAVTAGMDPKNGWVDVYPNQGKRSGAYMDGGGYRIHPFVLCNYLDNYDSLTTLAHEMGHAIHSRLTNRAQPFAKADYTIFLAEIASTTNEALLMEHMLDREKDPRKRLFLLGQRMESFRTTIFRQAMFAEFELAVYSAAEKDKPITADLLTKAYLKLLEKYYGHRRKVVKIDPRYALEWAYIPHFYYNYYVFQYTTGMTAATALSEKIRRKGTKARDRYIQHLLKAGASDYPIKLLRQAGVDLRTTKPYAVAMGVFKRALNEAEKIVKQQKLAR